MWEGFLNDHYTRKAQYVSNPLLNTFYVQHMIGSNYSTKNDTPRHMPEKLTTTGLHCGKIIHPAKKYTATVILPIGK